MGAVRGLGQCGFLGVQVWNEVVGQEGFQPIPHLGEIVVAEPGLPQPADVIGEPLGEPGVITDRQLTREREGNGGGATCRGVGRCGGRTWRSHDRRLSAEDCAGIIESTSLFPRLFPREKLGEQNRD